MKNLPKISDSEWQVMKVLWKEAPVTANRVIAALEDSTSWKPKTVKTLLNRLVKKSAAGYEIDKQDNRTYHYYPLVAEEECVRAESRSFLSRVYGGSLNLMLANFLEENDLSREEIEALKRILEKKEG